MVFSSSRTEAWLHNRPGHFAQRVPGTGAGGGGREAGEERLQMWTLGYFTGELLQTAFNPPNDIISAPCAGEVDSIWFNRNHNWLDQLRKWRQRGGEACSPVAQWLQVFVQDLEGNKIIHATPKNILMHSNVTFSQTNVFVFSSLPRTSTWWRAGCPL